jgi:hypothetical protein
MYLFVHLLAHHRRHHLRRLMMFHLHRRRQLLIHQHLLFHLGQPNRTFQQL